MGFIEFIRRKSVFLQGMLCEDKLQRIY